MKKLTADDLRALKWGDKVYRFKGKDYRVLRFVGIMPGNKNYLIFCEGEYLEHLYISPKDNSFKWDWYPEMEMPEIGKLLIELCTDNIEKIKLDILNIKDIYKC